MTDVTAKEVYERFWGLDDQADKLFKELEELKSRLCVCTVFRNGALAKLKPENLEAVVAGMLVTGAKFDVDVASTVMDMENDALCLSVHVKQLARDFREVWNQERETSSKEINSVSSRLEQQQSRLKEFKIRRCAHAISSPEVRDKVWAMTDGKCIYCEGQLTKERDPERPESCFAVDHVVAKSNGGPDHISNYVPSCFRCNSIKHARPVLEFLKRRIAGPDLKVVGGSEGGA